MAKFLISFKWFHLKILLNKSYPDHIIKTVVPLNSSFSLPCYSFLFLKEFTTFKHTTQFVYFYVFCLLSVSLLWNVNSSKVISLFCSLMHL